MNKKISTAIVVFVIVLVGGLLTVLFLMNERSMIKNPETAEIVPKNNEVKTTASINITDWKVYKNTAYNYELKYPADWIIGTTFGANPETFSAPSFTPANCFDDGVCPSFSVGNVHEIGKDEKIEDGISLNTEDRIIAKGEIEISGEKASFVEYYQASYGRGDGGMGLVRQEIKLIHNNTMYRFYIEEHNSDINKIKTSNDWKYKKVFEDMLESFVFTDSKKTETSSSLQNSSQAPSSEEELVSVLADKYQKEEKEVSITIKKEEGDFIRGGVEFEPGGEGNSGMFLATKINGKWVVVYDGNGVPDCNKLVGYGFSKDMLDGICD